MNLPAGTYDVFLRVGQAPNQWDTADFTTSFTVTGGGLSDPGSCSVPVCEVTGVGTCECVGSLYTLNCADPGQCECLNPSGQFTNDGSSAGVCASVGTAEAAWASLCQPSCVDPSPPSVCFAGGATLINPTGSGTCGDPYVVDLSSESSTSRFFFQVPGSNANAEDDITLGAGGTCLQGTARDIIFAVSFPAASMVGTVAAEGAGVDPIVASTVDNVCGDAQLSCNNLTGSAACESAAIADPLSTTRLIWTKPSFSCACS